MIPIRRSQWAAPYTLAMDELIYRSAVDLAGAIRSGELTSVQVVTAFLDRIDAVNGDVNAIVSRRSRADVLADAAAADGMEPVGPLHGLPIAVKDLEDVAGLPTRAGSLTTSDQPVEHNGHVAAKLRAAGAIIVGKTNTPEFGTGSHTFNEVFGVTRNPWDLGRTAGGSSGGAAAALAAHMLPIADGSDLGGSLRNPAHMCNVVGLRPSVGRVASPDSQTTHLRLGLSGPMGRTVADTALLMSAMAGPDPRDPLSLPEPGSTFAPPLPTTTTASVAWGGTLGGLFECDPEVLEIGRTAAQTVTAAGGVFAEDHPDMEHAELVFRVLRGMGYAGAGWQIPADQHELIKATVLENIAYGQSLTLPDVLAAEAHKAELHRRMTAFFDRYDILALPVAAVAAFPVETEYPTHVNGVEMRDYLGWMMAVCMITPTGCPAISIPAGFTSDGRPVGLQLVARLGHERQLLEIASAMEAANPHHHLRPDL